jgi:hypothetical protein
MVFRAMAMRAQRADCHDNCDGEAELVMEVVVTLYGIDCVELKGDIWPIADENSTWVERCFLAYK